MFMVFMIFGMSFFFIMMIVAFYLIYNGNSGKYSEWATGKTRTSSGEVICPDESHLVSLTTDKSERNPDNGKNGKIFSLTGVCSDDSLIGPLAGKGVPSGNNVIDSVNSIKVNKTLYATHGNRLEGLCETKSCGNLLGGIHKNTNRIKCSSNPIGFQVYSGNLIDDFRLICSNE